MNAMTLTDKIDDYGRPAWILLTVLGFVVWWPIGLALLAFTVWSGRMACSRYGMERWQNKMTRMQEKMDRVPAKPRRSKLKPPKKKEKAKTPCALLG